MKQTVPHTTDLTQCCERPDNGIDVVPKR